MSKAGKSTSKVLLSSGKILKVIAGEKFAQANEFRVDKQQQTMQLALTKMTQAKTFGEFEI